MVLYKCKHYAFKLLLLDDIYHNMLILVGVSDSITVLIASSNKGLYMNNRSGFTLAEVLIT